MPDVGALISEAQEYLGVNPRMSMPVTDSLVSRLAAALEESRTREEALRAALRPFVAAEDEKISHWAVARADWYRKMPGDWPAMIDVTVEDLRAARRALEPREDRDA